MYLPHEESLNSPLRSLIITNRRVRYTGPDSFTQSMSIQEVSYIGVVRKANQLFMSLATISGVIAGLGLFPAYRTRFQDTDILYAGLAAAVVFGLLYLFSKHNILQIQSRGGAVISITLSSKNLHTANQIMDMVENGKLNLE